MCVWHSKLQRKRIFFYFYWHRIVLLGTWSEMFSKCINCMLVHFHVHPHVQLIGHEKQFGIHSSKYCSTGYLWTGCIPSKLTHSPRCGLGVPPYKPNNVSSSEIPLFDWQVFFESVTGEAHSRDFLNSISDLITLRRAARTAAFIPTDIQKRKQFSEVGWYPARTSGFTFTSNINERGRLIHTSASEAVTLLHL